MTVCYFGIFDPSYPRNRIIIDGLTGHGHTVLLCSSRLPGLKKYVDLYRQHKKLRDQYDVMIVGYMGQKIMPLAKILSRKKIVFDAFLSIYNTMVTTRRAHSNFSIMALYYYLLDWASCRLATHVLLDTETHIDYFVETFKCDRGRFSRLLIGADNAFFYPTDTVHARGKSLRVLWWGWMTPLHGVRYILEAARTLQKYDIRFKIVGAGREKQELSRLKEEWGLENVQLHDTVPQDLVAREVNESDVCLGLFGLTKKVDLVVPNKVYEAFACKRAVITCASDAAREILTDRVNCLMCKPGSGEDLAEKILLLHNDRALLDRIAQGGYTFYTANCTPHVLSKQVGELISNYV